MLGIPNKLDPLGKNETYKGLTSFPTSLTSKVLPPRCTKDQKITCVSNKNVKLQCCEGNLGAVTEDTVTPNDFCYKEYVSCEILL